MGSALTSIEQLAADHIAKAHPRESDRKGSTRLLCEALEKKAPGAIDRARARHEKQRDEARFSGNPPEWAKRMVRRWAYASTTLQLQWRRSRTKSWTSGSCSVMGGRIVITAGLSPEIDHKITMAHEIGHANDPGSWNEPHGDSFYDEFYRVLKGEGLYRAAIAQRHYGNSIRRAARRARQKGAA